MRLKENNERDGERQLPEALDSARIEFPHCHDSIRLLHFLLVQTSKLKSERH